MDTYFKAGDPEDIAFGKDLISAGKVGCIVLAGGDGSRLGWKGPKGTFPISLVKQKTLFQLLSERVDAASNYYGRPLKLAIMTSPLNEEETKKAFPKGVDFFTQNLIPLLDLKNNPLQEKHPNGNGEVLKCFYKSGLFEKWKNEGVEIVQVIFIDNPLAEPYDPNQIGLHYKKNAEVTVKAVKKKDPNESVGLIGKKEGKLCVIEYSENPPQDWELANTSLFSFSFSFVEKVKNVTLPLHKVKKFLHGKPVYKRETFIFDLLTYTERGEVILYPREETFAPLKNREDLGRVQRALLERDRRMLEKIWGTSPKEEIIELSASFHYPTENLLKEWKNSPIPQAGYHEP